MKDTKERVNGCHGERRCFPTYKFIGLRVHMSIKFGKISMKLVAIVSLGKRELELGGRGVY